MDIKTTEQLLREVADSRAAWRAAERQFQADYAAVMKRLLNEAAYNMMSVEQVSAASGIPNKQVRAMMRRFNLNPKHGRKMLSEQAAKALHKNAALMGVKPEDMDLTSPLAYLPMGDALKRRLVEETTSVVTEVEE